MGYCVIAAIQRLTPKRTFTASSTPTTTQVESIIDDIAAEIDAALNTRGYTVPVTSPAAFLTFLGVVNAYGAAALAEAGMFPETVQAGYTPHWRIMEDKYQGWLKDLKEGKLSPNSLSNYASYYTEFDKDEEYTDGYPEPIFRVSSDDKEF